MTTSPYGCRDIIDVVNVMLGETRPLHPVVIEGALIGIASIVAALAIVLGSVW